MTTEIAKPEERIVSFTPFGAADAIKLSVRIIQNLVAVPTKSGKTCSERDAMKFLMLCQAKRLNPFEGDAYLVGYDTNGVAQFSLITAEQTFLKRAETHKEFDGIESGLVIENEDGQRNDIQGELYSEDQNCVGGWARVHFKSRKIPSFERLSLKKMMKPGPFWEKNPEHQIAKCARVAALRRAFPTMLGGLYSGEELNIIDIKPESLSLPLSLPKSNEPEHVENPVQPDLSGPTETASDNVGPSVPGKELGQFVTAEGFTWEQFRKWAVDSGNLDPANDWNGFDELPAALARRLLRAKSGLKMGLQQIREAQSK